MGGPSIPGAGGRAPPSIHRAAEEGNLGVVRSLLKGDSYLVSRTVEYNLTPLHLAAAGGHIEVAALLLEASANANARDYGGGTPLHSAAQGGHAEVAALLLTRGKAQVNAKDTEGYAPLHRAARQGHAAAAAVLVARGAEVNAKGDHIGTPLHEAASAGHRAVAELLLDNLAMANARSAASYEPWTPWHDAMRGGHRALAALLRQHGGEDAAAGPLSIHRAAEAGYPGRIEVLLRHEPELIASRDFLERRTPLHWAALAGRTAIVERLLAAGADVAAKDKRGKTALELAEAAGQGHVVAVLRGP